MSHHNRRYSRPKSCSLETLAIVNGILESPASQHPLIERLRMRLSSEGTNGIGYSKLQHRLNILDADGSQAITLEDFQTALKKCNIGFEESDYRQLFQQFSSKDQSYIDIPEFVMIVRGPISSFRRKLIERAFYTLDERGDGIFTCEEVIEKFDPTQHPDVKNRVKKSQDVFREFLKAFEVGGEIENKITKNEFYNYFYNLSASIDDDDYFAGVLTGTWHLRDLALDNTRQIPQTLNIPVVTQQHFDRVMDSRPRPAANEMTSSNYYGIDNYYGEGPIAPSSFTKERPLHRYENNNNNNNNEGNHQSTNNNPNSLSKDGRAIYSRPQSSNDQFIARKSMERGYRSEGKTESEQEEIFHGRDADRPLSPSSTYRIYQPRSRSPSPNPNGPRREYDYFPQREETPAAGSYSNQKGQSYRSNHHANY